MSQTQQPSPRNPLLPCVRRRLFVQVPDTQEVVPLTLEVWEEIQAKIKDKLNQKVTVYGMKESLNPLYFPLNGLSTQTDDVLPRPESIFRKFSVYGAYYR